MSELASMKRLRMAKLLFAIVVLAVQFRLPFIQYTVVLLRSPVNEQLRVTLLSTDILIKMSEVTLMMCGGSK